MAPHPTEKQNWFDQGGAAYLQFRPEYPDELARLLGAVAPGHDLAVDVGCGNGQLTVQLAGHFSRVAGFDPSADQLASAMPRDNVRYAVAPAEDIPLPDSVADLVTTAQAAHWFDLPRFFREARRIARPGAAIALVSYGVLQVPEGLQARFSRFYYQEAGPFWPPERKMVDGGYRDLDFPFKERRAPEIAIHRIWSLEEFLGYVSTWSAVRRLREAGHQEMLADFADDISALWGDGTLAFSWPINMRLGTL